MWLISLLFLPLSFAFITLPYGIQYETLGSNELEEAQCTPCLFEYYETPISSEDILSCTGPVLFVGAERIGISGSGNYLGAFALAEEIHKITELNTPHESNGVYWYFTPGKSFGFLKDKDLQQATADIGTTNPRSRLSWNLGKYGGYRVGYHLGLSDTIEMFWKVIWNCPFYV